MNKKLFDRRLMREAMRQVRLPGLIGLLLIVGVSFFSVYIELINLSYGGGTLTGYDFEDLNPYIMLVMYTFAPLMVMTLFGFMNKRRASDFYHSLAFTRTCMYTSYIAAVLLWCIIMIAAGSLTTILVAGLSGKMDINAVSAARTIADSAAGVFLTMSVMAFAMTLTGTYLTNVITALLFLFAPRGFVMLCMLFLSEALPFAVFSENTIMSSACNIPFGIPAELFASYSYNYNLMFTSWLPAVYTMVLGLIYYAAGAVYFAKRRSENATMASVSRGLQCFLRIIPAVLISFISISILFNAHSSGYAVSRSDLFVVIMTYAAAAVAYFLYEIITTRRASNLLRAIPGLGIVVVINLALYFGLRFSYDYHISQLPEKQELEYVVVHGPEDSLLWKDTEDVKLYSEAARGVASDCLKDTVSLWLNSRTGVNGFYNQYYSGNCMIVEYHYPGGKSILRKVIVNETRYGQLKKALVGEGDFAESFGKSVYKMENMDYSIGCLESERADEVYEVFLSEIRSKGIAQLFEISNNRIYDDKYLFSIDLWDKSGKKYSSIYIGSDMPLTATAYMNAVNEEYPENECELFAEAAGRMKEKAGADMQEVAYSYFDCSLYLEMYMVKPDGTFATLDSYSSACFDSSYLSMPSEEGLENIAKLGRLTKVRDITAAELEPGTILLLVSFYEYGNVERYTDDVYGNEVQNVTCTVNESDFGWYIINDLAAELVKSISMDEAETVFQD